MDPFQAPIGFIMDHTMEPLGASFSAAGIKKEKKNQSDKVHIIAPR